MPKYLQKVRYTQQGIRGLLEDGGSKRRDMAQAVADGLGVRLEAFYFAFGDPDAYLIVDAPDDETVTAVSLAITAAGGAVVENVKLLEPSQVDDATRKTVNYRPPGA